MECDFLCEDIQKSRRYESDIALEKRVYRYYIRGAHSFSQHVTKCERNVPRGDENRDTASGTAMLLLPLY